MTEIGDKQEEFNMGLEGSLSIAMYAKIKHLAEMCDNLRAEYSKLDDIGKVLQDIIKKKEQENTRELEDSQNTAENAKLEKSESTLSKEEAQVLQEMLAQLAKTTKQGQKLVKDNKLLHSVMRDIYKKDLDDYELEVADLTND